MQGAADTEGRYSGSHRDLISLSVVLGLTWAVVTLPILRTSPIRTLFGAATLFLLPGYALVKAGFATRSSSVDLDSAVNWLERWILAISASLVVAMVWASMLAITSLRVDPVRMLVGPTSVSVLGMAITYWKRRSRLGTADEVTDRSRLTVRRRLDDLGGIDLAMIALVLASLGGSGYLLAVHQPAGYAELSLLAPGSSGTDGTPSATIDGNTTMTVHVANHHQQPTTYTVIAVAERVTVTNRSVAIRDRRTLDRFRSTVDPEANWSISHDLHVPSSTDRVAYLLFRGAPPERPTRDNAAAAVHVWVRPGNSSGNSSSNEIESTDPPTRLDHDRVGRSDTNRRFVAVAPDRSQYSTSVGGGRSRDRTAPVLRGEDR